MPIKIPVNISNISEYKALGVSNAIDKDSNIQNEITQKPTTLSKPNKDDAIYTRKSGIIWKRNKARFSSMLKKNKAQTLSYKKYIQKKTEHQEMKEQERRVKELFEAEKKDRREKFFKKLELKKKNEMKGLIVQPITNTNKLKKLTPKQLRSIMRM